MWWFDLWVIFPMIVFSNSNLQSPWLFKVEYFGSSTIIYCSGLALLFFFINFIMFSYLSAEIPFLPLLEESIVAEDILSDLLTSFFFILDWSNSALPLMRSYLISYVKSLKSRTNRFPQWGFADLLVVLKAVEALDWLIVFLNYELSGVWTRLDRPESIINLIYNY